jgi:hypothetical protein
MDYVGFLKVPLNGGLENHWKPVELLERPRLFALALFRLSRQLLGWVGHVGRPLFLERSLLALLAWVVRVPRLIVLCAFDLGAVLFPLRFLTIRPKTLLCRDFSCRSRAPAWRSRAAPCRNACSRKVFRCSSFSF